jgi:hypothetical protein
MANVGCGKADDTTADESNPRRTPPGDELASEAATDLAALLADSRDTHGDAVENQEHIAAGWTWYLRGAGYLAPDESLTGADVGMMMPLVKMSRAVTGTEDIDHYRDVGGYAMIAMACLIARGDADLSELERYRDGEGEYA